MADCQNEKTLSTKTEEMPATDVSYPLLFTYGVGHVLNDLCASMWFTYLLIYFLYVLQFNDVLAGAALMIGQVADGIATPIIGLFSDKSSHSWLCKFGRRKTWHLLGTVCVLCTFPFIFSPCYGFPDSSHFYQLWYYSFFIVIFQFGWASTQISHLSLVPELTSSQHGRTSLLALRYTFTVFSNIIVYLVTWLVFHLNKNGDTVIGPSDKHKFQTVAYVVVVLGAVTSMVFHVGVKEKVNLDEDNRQLIQSSQDRASLLQCKRLYNVACVYMATRLFVNLSQVYIPLYLQGFLNLPSELLAILPLVMFASSFLTSIIIQPLNVEFGRKLTYIYGTLLGLGACLWVQLGKDYYYANYEIYGVVMTFGCASSIMLVTSLGITADLIGADTNNGAFVYGLMSFSDKISNGVAVMLIQYLKCTDDCPAYYRNTILYSCGGAAIFALLSVFVIQPETAYSNTFTGTVEEEVKEDLNDDDDDASGKQDQSSSAENSHTPVTNVEKA